MAGRVERALTGAGCDEREVGRVLRALERAMAHREPKLPDDHHPDWLHPGRTVLVALEDAGVRDPDLLALAPLLDSLNPELAPPLDAGSPQAAARAALEPLPLAALEPLPPDEPGGGADPDTLLEHLVTLEPEALALVLAEALDQLRHLHLSDDPERQRQVAERTRTVVLPLVGRLGGTLDRRLRWWWRRVGLGMAGGEA